MLITRNQSFEIEIPDRGNAVDVKSRVVLQLLSTMVTPVKTTALLFRVFPKKILHILLNNICGHVFVVKEMENMSSCEDVTLAKGLYH